MFQYIGESVSGPLHRAAFRKSRAAANVRPRPAMSAAHGDVIALSFMRYRSFESCRQHDPAWNHCVPRRVYTFQCIGESVSGLSHRAAFTQFPTVAFRKSRAAANVRPRPAMSAAHGVVIALSFMRYRGLESRRQQNPAWNHCVPRRVYMFQYIGAYVSGPLHRAAFTQFLTAAFRKSQAAAINLRPRTAIGRASSRPAPGLRSHAVCNMSNRLI